MATKAPWRSAKQRDANEKAIVDGLRAHGYHVYRLDEPADLAVLIESVGLWQLLEVKNPDTHARRKGGDLRTAAQTRVLPEIAATIPEVQSLADALRILRFAGPPPV